MYPPLVFISSCSHPKNARLMSENDVLRRRNLLLEEKCIAYDVEGVKTHRNLSKNKTTDNTISNRKKLSDWPDETTEEKVIEANDRVNIAALRTKLRNVSRENVILKSENEVRNTYCIEIKDNFSKIYFIFWIGYEKKREIFSDCRAVICRE